MYVHVYLVDGNEYVPLKENMELTKVVIVALLLEEVPVIIVMKHYETKYCHSIFVSSIGP